MPKKPKQIPKFKSEDEERDFWAKHDVTDYFEEESAQINAVFPNLKPTQTAISMRISESLLAMIKSVASKKDVPYQSLMKHYLSEAVQKDFDKFVKK